MTEAMKGLAVALAKVQAALPDLERDRTVEVQQKNGDTYSYSYATLANLSKVALPLLAANGLAFTAFPGAGSDGKMCLRYHLLHDSGESLTGEFPLSAEGGIQQLGGRITYARRYCLAAVIGLAAEEDDEARLEGDGRTAQRAAAPRPVARPAAKAGEPKPTAQRRQPSGPPPLPGEGDKLTVEQGRKMHAVFREAGVDEREARLKWASDILGHPVTSSNDLTREEAGRVIDAVEAFIAQERGPKEGEQS